MMNINLSSPQKPFIITVASTKGGSAKSTNAANIGAFCAEHGLKTLLIDTDTQPTLSVYFSLVGKFAYTTSHLALHGKVYRADDPIWQTMYPPNDWGCRCRVEALSELAVERAGYQISSSAGAIETEETVVGVDKETGEKVRTHVSKIKTDQGEMKVGAGWNYNVGSAGFGSDVAVLRKLQQIKNRELRQEVIQAINNSEVRHKAFADWVMANLGKRGASARYISAGFVTTEIAEKVAEITQNKTTSELVLVMSEKRLAHANSEKHHQGGVGLSADEYASLSRIIADPSLVLWDKLEGHNNLIYINQNRTIQVIVDVPNYHQLKPKERVDAIINAYKVDMSNIIKHFLGGNYVLIKGEL